MVASQQSVLCRHGRYQSCALSDATESAGLEVRTSDNFESEYDAAAEDRLRARQIRRVLNRPGPTGWRNIKDRLWLARQRLPRVVAPQLNRGAMTDLAVALERGSETYVSPHTLASSLQMRRVRLGLNEALLDAFASYDDEELRTVTVIYAGWSLTPTELESVTAAQVKAQFRQHLHRAGVLLIPGPLLAVLHGEFEPTSGRYQLHFHIVTTATKAAAMKAGLTVGKIKGYRTTATGGSAVRCSRIGNRVRQLSYIAKGFWPCKPVVEINGEPKRVRNGQRIPEPYHTQHLLWLDRQRFADLVVMTDCWSLRGGGSAAMKRLYLFVSNAG